MVAPPSVNTPSPGGAAGPARASATVPPSPVPPSPVPRRARRPRWLDTRLVLGVVLVVGSVVLGAVVVSRASETSSMWSLRRDLPAGAVLAASDLAAVDVRLGDDVRGYVPAGDAVVGRRLVDDVGAGQLLPTSALEGDGGQAQVTVSIPFDRADAPSLTRGDRITVWVSTPTCASVVLLSAVGVQEVSEGGSGLAATGGLEVVVSVSPELADRVVRALALDDVVLRAGVLSGAAGATSADDLPDLGPCAATRSGGAAATPTATPS